MILPLLAWLFIAAPFVLLCMPPLFRTLHNCDLCSSGTTPDFQIDISGMADGTDCTGCSGFDGTWLAQFSSEISGSQCRLDVQGISSPFVSCPASPCIGTVVQNLVSLTILLQSGTYKEKVSLGSASGTATASTVFTNATGGQKDCLT